MPPRIFLGLNEICNITYTLADAFKKLGCRTFTAIRRRNRYFVNSQYDLVLLEKSAIPGARYWRLGRMLAEALATCDVFVFTYFSLLPRYADLPLLKRLGKKIVFVFWGSEIRWVEAFEQQMTALGVLEEYRPFIEGMRAAGEEPLQVKLRRLRSAERYADLILSQPGYAQLQQRPYMRASVPLDLSRYSFHVPDRAAPLILHAPSNPQTKGADVVVNAVEELRKEGLQFEFRFIHNLSNPELRELLSSADILIDELYGDTIGTLSSEGMATGNAVLTHHPGEWSGVPEPCPVVSITRHNLKERLRQVITDRELRRRLAYEGRAYVERHNDHRKIAADILRWLEPGGIRQYDFTPVFYQQYHGGQS